MAFIIKLFYGSEIKSEIENGSYDSIADATDLDKTVIDIFNKNGWQPDFWESEKKAAIKSVLKDCLFERKTGLVPSLLNAAQSLIMADKIPLPLTPDSADQLCQKLRRIKPYNVFKPHEISYILRNYSAVISVLQKDQIISISPKGRILLNDNLNDHQEHRLQTWMKVWKPHAKFDHEKQKAAKAAILEQKAGLIGSMLQHAQSLNRIGNAKTVLTNNTSLNSVEADHLTSKLINTSEYGIFDPYEISYILQNFSSVTKALALAQIIDISEEGRVKPKADLTAQAKNRCGELVETFYQAAKNTHKESKQIHERSTDHFSIRWNLPQLEVDKKIYAIIFGITPFRKEHQQIIKAIQDKSPETLKQAYQTLEAHLQNPQKPTDPYQRRIL
ncbi:MAG: hypothetical protein KF898_09655 [Parachlamydiales bacterium]|nr:hypothetical protein [Candidatus Acheromyda pituitae]